MHTLEQLKSGKLAGTKKIKLSCGLTEFPPEIFDLAETLEVIDLSGNQLTNLPDGFGQLKNLIIAFFSDNHFTVFPSVLSQCPQLEMVGFKANKIAFIPENALPENLRWLILTDNCLTAIPANIGKCLRIQKLMLAGNKIVQLPPELASCRNLQLLRISANLLTTLPAWLFALPRLSWLAFAGNPCSAKPKIINNLPAIAWDDLSLQEQLGEGASGIISKAFWRTKVTGESLIPVAVKVFKGAVTSDGLPSDELAACIAAGRHPNIVQVLGEVQTHPLNKQGLVLDLIPATFRNLGNAPSFETCTRDTYSIGTAFLFPDVLNISIGMASAAAHLHARGIMHGDLYAHNILTDEMACPLLGDFGAASFYNKSDTKQAPLLERLEVRAFGCLLEDLINRLAPEDSEVPDLPILMQLKEACMADDIMKRPDFAAIYEHLRQLVPDKILA